MNSEYIIQKEHICWINEKYGGSLRTDAEIEDALFLRWGKSIYTKIAYLWKAILIDRPFTDGNKRTALMVTLYALETAAIPVSEKQKIQFVAEITKIARENKELKQIERLIRYVITGH